jgi:RNA polymerase sigma factor (sigma-70 family)
MTGGSVVYHRPMGADPALPRRVAPTRWSLVHLAGRRPTAQSRDALAELCRLYWFPIYAFARRRGLTADDAHDLTQGFFASLIEKNTLATVDPVRGHFRSWLLGAFKHFLSNAEVRQQAQKRGGGTSAFELDAVGADSRYQRELSHELTPERLFERRWTLELIEQTLAVLGADYERRGEGPVFQALKAGLALGEVSPHAQVAEALGMSEQAVRQAAARLRRRFGEQLFQAVADTLEATDDVEVEVRRLLAQL